MNLCKNKTERKEKFKRNAVDKFILELEDVGPIEKIRIGHDNAGMGSGWHVDRVEIRRLREDGRVFIDLDFLSLTISNVY